MAILVRKRITADQDALSIFCLGMNYVGVNIAGNNWTGTFSFSMAQQTFGYTGPGVGAGSPIGTSIYPYNTAPTPTNGVGNIGGPQVVTGQVGVTANGQWYWPVQNAAIFTAKFTLGSGSLVPGVAGNGPIVTLTASVDSSYADAFLYPGGPFGNKFLVSTVGGARNILTIPADIVYGRRLRTLVVTTAAESGSGGSSVGPANAIWTGNPILQVLDGSTVIWAQDINTAVPQQYSVPLPTTQQHYSGIQDGGLLITPGNIGQVILASPGGGIITNIVAEIAAA
jgi:hypothetical protein